MENKYLINQNLPTEVLQKIFVYVQDKRECQLVCKLWNYAVNDTAHLVVSVSGGYYLLKQFLLDLKQYPTFGPKIYSINHIHIESKNVANSNFRSRFTAAEVQQMMVTFKSIIKLCPKLRKLQLNFHREFGEL